MDSRDINEMIKEHFPFIIKIISRTTGRYVRVGEDEEITIGLLAFAEAVDKFDESKGSFLGFAKLVIESRLKTFLSRNNGELSTSLDQLHEAGIEFAQEEVPSREILKEEIVALTRELNYFGFTLDEVAKDAPRHSDTRRNAISLSKKVSEHEPFVEHLYEKKRLPVKAMSLKYTVTEKVIKGSKRFIITTVVIFHKKYGSLLQWLKGKEGSDE